MVALWLLQDGGWLERAHLSVCGILFAFYIKVNFFKKHNPSCKMSNSAFQSFKRSKTIVVCYYSERQYG